MSRTKVHEQNWPPGPRLLVSLVISAAVVAVPLAALAGAKDRDSKERTARTACLAGDYAKGVALLAELYVSTKDIAYLFNQARCFEQNGKYEEAILRFHEYQLKNADAGNPPDESAEKHIASCQALLDKQKAGQVATLPPVTPTVTAPAVPAEPKPVAVESPGQRAEAKPEATVEPKADVSASIAPETPGRGLRVAGIAAAAVGVAGLAAGVVFNLKANSLASDLESANGSSTTLYSRSKESSRSSYATLTWVAYGAGAACMAGGAVLYFFGRSPGPSTQVALAPAVGVGEVGAVLQGAF